MTAQEGCVEGQIWKANRRRPQAESAKNNDFPWNHSRHSSASLAVYLDPKDHVYRFEHKDLHNPARMNKPTKRKRSTEESHWTVRPNEPNLSHEEVIGEGGYGEVHKVCSPPTFVADMR